MRSKAATRTAPADWPWRDGNRFELLDASEQYFQRMTGAIDAAQTYVLMEMYLVQSGVLAGRFVEAFISATQRGVSVRLLIDGFGALGFAHADRRRLLAAGVQLRVYNTIRLRRRLHNFLRDHRKLMLVDGTVAFVGGVGLTDEFAITGPPGWPWRDLVVEIHGPVLRDWEEAFDRSWARSAPENPELAQADGAARAAGESAEDENATGSERAELQNATGGERGGLENTTSARGRVVLSEAWYRSALANAVAHRIGTAHRRVWIMSAYFVPSRRFRKALRGAARRGVDVRLLVPGPLTDHPWVRQAARRFYGKLLRNSVRIFEFQPRVLHSKMTVCDDWVSVGSSNLDRWSFKWNLEANQEVEDADFAAMAAAVFEHDCAQSLELDRRRWAKRAWVDRLRERVAGAFDRWLDQWRRPFS